jgi:hypothetical protein
MEEKIEKRLERLEHHLATYLSDLTTNDRRDEVLEESDTSEKATDEATTDKGYYMLPSSKQSNTHTA